MQYSKFFFFFSLRSKLETTGKFNANVSKFVIKKTGYNLTELLYDFKALFSISAKTCILEVKYNSQRKVDFPGLSQTFIFMKGNVLRPKLSTECELNPYISNFLCDCIGILFHIMRSTKNICFGKLPPRTLFLWKLRHCWGWISILYWLKSRSNITWVIQDELLWF